MFLSFIYRAKILCLIRREASILLYSETGIVSPVSLFVFISTFIESLYHSCIPHSQVPLRISQWDKCENEMPFRGATQSRWPDDQQVETDEHASGLNEIGGGLVSGWMFIWNRIAVNDCALLISKPERGDPCIEPRASNQRKICVHCLRFGCIVRQQQLALCDTRK